MNRIWTIQSCLNWSKEYLERHGDVRPRLSAEWLLSAAVDMQRIELYINFDKPMSAKELSYMHNALTRRAKGEPLQYITGRAPFRMLEVDVAPGVLIPRPETEILVDEVLSYIDTLKDRQATQDFAQVKLNSGANDERFVSQLQKDDNVYVGRTENNFLVDKVPPARILEIGTGTGCIACSIASERPGTTVVAVDIEPRAIDLAMKNRKKYNLDDVIDIREGDLCSPITEEEYHTFDVLVSNPPYIPSDIMKELPHEVVDFEPSLALHGGVDGLSVFRHLLKQAPKMLRTGGLFACELHETMLDLAKDLALDAGFLRAEIVDDLAGKPRHLLAYK